MGFILVKTQLCYKKITKEYRLARDFNFVVLYEVSQSVLFRCTRTDTFVNKSSDLSSLVAQTFLSSCWDSTWFKITSKNTMTPLKMLLIKLKS